MILISLLGEQPIPNLLPLWQDPQRYTATRFAVTESTLPLAERLAAVIAEDPRLSHLTVRQPVLLQPYDIGASRTRLNSTLMEHFLHNEQVTLNLTGGTKIMSLAALQAVYGSGVPLLYVSTETRSIIHLRSDGSELERELLAVQVSVRQYLAAHGIESSLHPAFRLDGPARPMQTPKSGDALERRVENLLRVSGSFDDVRRNVFIRKPGREEMVNNELDVVATRNGRLVVCSCKTSLEIDRDDLYELAALSRRESFGIYCKKVLVCEHEPSTAIKDRAASDGVRLVYGSKIEHIAETLRMVLD